MSEIESKQSTVTTALHKSPSNSEFELQPSSPSSLNATNPLSSLEIDTALDPDASQELESTDCKPGDYDDESKPQDSCSKEVTVKSKKVRQRLWTTVLSAIVACIPFLLIGCTLGFPSGALLDLIDLEERAEFKLTREQADLFGALGYIGAVFGGPIAGLISDRVGRKPALMLVSVPYLTGYMMITYARFAVDPVLFKVILLLGRFFSGVGLGWASLAVVVYIAEISPAKVRGRIGSIVQVFLSLGVVVVYALSSFENFRYYNTSLVLVGFVALFTVSMPFFCETPRWLLAHRQKRKAIAALKFLRGPKYDIRSELDSIQANIASTPHLKAKQVLKEFTKGNVIVPMVLALLSAIFLQGGGLNAIIAYSSLILRNAGVSSFRQISLYGTGLTRLGVNVIALFLTDLFGRKILLFVSSIGTFLGTMMLGVHFYVTNPSYCFIPLNSTNISQISPQPTSDICNPQLGPLAVTAIVVYNVGFSIGWGPIVWLLLGELLPLQVRGIGTGLATFVMWGLTAVVAGTYLGFAEAAQPYVVWWMYSAVNFVSLLFTVFCLFETKGKSLEDIQGRFEMKYGRFKLFR